MQTSETTFETQVALLRPQIERALKEYTRFSEDCPDKLSQAIDYVLLDSGKRLRPILVLLTTQACSGEVAESLPAACAVEMIHCYSLVHDDLPAMDDDDLRRGKPTCHLVFDEATAILTGDALLTRAFEILTDLDSPSLVTRCLKELATAAGPLALIGGQVDDLGAPELLAKKVGKEEALAQLMKIHRRKTGAMFSVSVRLGALVAKASEAEIAFLEKYSEKVGLAFQITDDLLDEQGEEKFVGKRTQKDATAGKLTFPRLIGIQESREYASQLIEEACLAIMPLGEKGENLRLLAQYVLERNR
ncbi:MAG: polyprenyl synthetase family protein [Pirellulaceae bacterium]|nr:polyprenyl synthetase family protein [Pirellulaceae bacterium]